MLLTTASEYSRKSLGTLPPEGLDSQQTWDKNNFFTIGAIVSDEDALRIAAAINPAIEDLSDLFDSRPVQGLQLTRSVPQILDEESDLPMDNSKVREKVSLEMGFEHFNTAWLRKFAKFCLQGKFKVL